MNTLTLHIEYLLTLHDCVVIPGFGGIVLRHKEAEFSKKHQLMSPHKVAGFNPSLNHNDGLLANSLMRERNLTFNEAMILIESAVKEMNGRLVHGERIELGSVGSFYMDESSSVQFVPSPKNYFDLELFGFEDLQILPLQNRDKELPVAEVHTSESNPDVILVPLNLRVLRHIGSVAAIIIGMLMIAQPLEDSQIPDNYASLISSDLITRAVTPVAESVSSVEYSEYSDKGDEFAEDAPFSEQVMGEEVKDEEAEVEMVEVESLVSEAVVSETVTPEVITPEAVTSEKVSETPAIEKKLQKVPQKRYYIIVGSFPTSDQAFKRIAALSAKGYSGIDFIKKGDKYRLFINSFQDKGEANRFLDSFRVENPSLSDAWLLAHTQ